jgi:signal transduction histidine kinase
VLLDGKRHDFEIRLVPNSGKNTLGILRDITQRNRLEREILEVSGREQRRIGRELHDGLCQHLAGIAYLAQALSRRVPPQEIALARDAGELADLVVEAISLTKGLIRGLIPVRLETEGLKSALIELTSNSGRLFGVECQVEEPFADAPRDPTTRLHLYRIAQEALNNAIKHGKASRVVLSLEVDSSLGTLRIQDNGVGFNSEATAETGLGLGIMRYRALMIGGTIAIHSAEGQGTNVVCKFSEMAQR